MEALFEFVVQGWSQSENVAASAAEIPQPPVDNSLATSTPSLAIPTPGGNRRKKKKNDCSHSSQEVYKGDILKERVKEVGQPLPDMDKN
ncbi:hypothetical protein R3I93_003487 [Phoxinus phoxinus]|uniref:Uncharacterized protein n=1 Tax=Phoxinus phoxinus TaxID=58324 RepID=A0AAN9HI24_9TELE